MGFIKFMVGFVGILLLIGALMSFAAVTIFTTLATGSFLQGLALPVVALLVAGAMIYYGFFKH